MAMAVDNRQQSQLNMGYDPLRYPAQPHFTNPWVSAPPTSQQMYPTTLASHVSGLEGHATSQPQSVQRPTSIAIPYHGLPVTAPSLGSGITLPDGTFATEDLLDVSQDLLSRSYTGGYASSSSSNTNSYAPTSAPYSQVEYGNSTRSPYGSYQQDTSRRSSHPSVPSMPFFDNALESQRQRQSSLVDFSRINSQQPQRNSFSDALDASRGMVSLSQSDITPRNIYGTQGSSRSSTDSYGFPSTHSAHSSISSASYNGGYYNEGSVTDYSSASESVDLSNSRTLPRPNGLMGANIPPAPQSMMSQFSSKVSSSSQKKHKCKICDKRFTRPSSLQTHMYSHTGEKPFACEVEGCGRHFSVVSNLRRHRKVHKGEGLHDHPSPDDA
ncbi:hypothetical protein K505DRAFT_397785 [Melanomma pulvis-pyrius CBS 109.77]|uniref:C2H2-type domain-containing protein n=1 Tax=Melanomma pulvis-pyrius CBS 109.77 TaxID=1314802 RepID=A0A6A6XN17_9PLEO|nr:hypothetical protein K505DRAFT_397785 [Melanomma pulvis-pyrius CBS 109.77]